MNISIIDHLNKFREIDLSNCKTREEKILLVMKNCKYLYDKNIFFKLLTKEEKEKYFCYLSDGDRITYLHKTKGDIIERVYNNVINENVLGSYELEKIGESIKDEDERYEYLKKMHSLMEIHYTYLLSETINNKDYYENIAFNILDKKPIYLLRFIITKFTDEQKEEYLDRLTIGSQVSVIKSFTNKKLIKKYAEKEEYSQYRSELIISTEEENYIIEKFITTTSLKLKLNIINKVKDQNLKTFLTCFLDDKNMMEFLISNSYEPNVSENVTSLINRTKIDNKITIGVELETCNTNIKDFEKIKSIFNDYLIKGDKSVKSGFEIVSPILHYNIHDMNLLNGVCELLKTCKFYTDSSCGGHIHIGASYLTRKEDYLMLLYLYNNVENIMYYITDKEGTIKRENVSEYAMKTKDTYIEAITEGKLNKDTKESIIETLQQINQNRYKGLNFKNIGLYGKNTIEFRMPNGEIEFSELLANIKLFAKLIEMSHKLVDMPKTDITKLKAQKLCYIKNDEEKLNCFLEILFSNQKDREIYINRYKKNKELTEKAEQKLTTLLSNELFTTEEIVVDYDEEKHALVKKII